MEKQIKRATFEGGPLNGDSIELPFDVIEYKTLKLETVLNPYPTDNAQHTIEHQEITYKEEPVGSGHFVCEN